MTAHHPFAVRDVLPRCTPPVKTAAGRGSLRTERAWRDDVRASDSQQRSRGWQPVVMRSRQRERCSPEADSEVDEGVADHACG
jgi:hypothetical protein